MSSSSKSESYQSSDVFTSETDMFSLAAKIMAVHDGTAELESQVGKMQELQKAIYDYKGSHMHRTKQMKEMIIHLSKNLGITGKNLVQLCGERSKEVTDAAAPYINSGPAPADTEPSKNVMNRCIELLSTVQGVNGNLERTNEVSAKVLKHHNMLNRIEAKQRDAMARYEEIVRLENLARDIPSEEPIFQVANLPMILLALSGSPNISAYYQKNFKDLKERVSALVAQIRFNNNNNEFPGSLSSMSNGEIDLKSLEQVLEHPLDSLLQVNTQGNV